MNGKAPARDVTIIGAGVIGICTALALQGAGCRVTLLDRQPPGSGCSSGNAGGITPSAVVPIATPGIMAAVPRMLTDPLSPLAIRWSYLPRLLPWLVRFLRAGTTARVAEISAALAAMLTHAVESWPGCSKTPARRSCGGARARFTSMRARRHGAPCGAITPCAGKRAFAMLPRPGIEIALPMMSGDGKFAITPMEEGLRLAGTVELGGLAAAPNYERARILIRKAKRMFPGLSDEGARLWMGFRPSMPDSLPVIGAVPSAPSVILAFGHGHLGLTLGAATGRLVADLMTGRPLPIDLAPFRVDRFGWLG